MAINIKQNDNGTADFVSESLGKGVLRLGGSEQPTAGGSTIAYHGSSYVKITLGQLSGTSGVLSVINPFNEDVIVGRTILNVTSGFGTTTAFMSFGVGTTASTSYGNNLIDSVTANTAVLLDNITDKGTNGKSRQLWTSGTYITGTASVTPHTLIGQLFVEVLRV